MRLLVVFFLIFPTTVFAVKNPLRVGFLFLEKKNYQRAFQSFSSVKQKNPEVYTSMGMAKALQGDYERALDYLFIALEDKGEKEKWAPNYFVGICFYNLKRFNEAIPFLEKAYRLTSDISILKTIVESAFQAGRYVEAESHAKNLYTLENTEKNLILFLKVLTELKKFKEAEELATEFLKSQPDSAGILYERAKTRFYRGLIELAEKDLEKAIFINKSNDKMSLYSAIKSLKPQQKVKEIKTYNFNNIRWLLYLLSLLFSALIVIFLYRRKTLNSRKEKIFFANTLLEKADYINAINIFNELRDIKSLKNQVITGLLRAHLLLGKKEDAINLAEQLNSEEERFFFLALIYLYSGDKQGYVRYLNILENSNYNEKVRLLKNLMYSGKDKQTQYLIREDL